ncbi:4'-phosphopantetheinyl transferase family protein [Luteipulveratus halotolerans]|uniref:4'-phosphopantetheinyl transferase family protein n=1 Tax=Luteipulveratus halotolerans TaxID=1631356 RepID=UPI000680FE6B|nr:hypothetical protein [Luteipulveratus halotolerans]
MTVDVLWAPLTLADDRLTAVLDSDERDRIARLRAPADRARTLLGAVVLRLAVAAHTGADPSALRVERTCTTCGRPHGRPWVAGSGVEVSVSHSGVLVAVAVSSHARVGVDVQRAADLDAGQDVESWVRDEAVLKACWGLRPQPRTTVAPLRPPQHGYAAALAAVSATAPSITERDATPLIGAHLDTL